MTGTNRKLWMLAAGALMMAAPLAAPAMAQDTGSADRRDRMEMPRLITVTGQAEIRRKPDIVTLNVGIEERGTDVRAMRDEAAKKAQAAIQALISAGVRREDIQTAQFTIRREWEQDPDPEPRPANYRPRGRWIFVLNNTVSVRTTMVDKAGDLLDAVVRAGFNNVNGPYFALEDDAAAQREALEMAVREARSKADVIAKATGVTIRGVESVTEGGAMPPPRPMMMERFAGAAVMDKAPSTPIESGEIVVSSSVSASFRI